MVKTKNIFIYIKDNKEEIKKEYFNDNDNVSKINIIVDYKIKSFNKLFYYCERIESIHFQNLIEII